MKLSELIKRIDNYFNECEEAGIFPDEAGMALYLGVERQTLDDWIKNDSPRGFSRAIRNSRLRRESVLVRGIYASDKSTTGKIFLSRQGSAGALSDKTNDSVRSGGLSVEVTLGADDDYFD